MDQQKIENVPSESKKTFPGMDKTPSSTNPKTPAAGVSESTSETDTVKESPSSSENLSRSGSRSSSQNSGSTAVGSNAQNYGFEFDIVSSDNGSTSEIRSDSGNVKSHEYESGSSKSIISTISTALSHNIRLEQSIQLSSESKSEICTASSDQPDLSRPKTDYEKASSNTFTSDSESPSTAGARYDSQKSGWIFIFRFVSHNLNSITSGSSNQKAGGRGAGSGCKMPGSCKYAHPSHMPSSEMAGYKYHVLSRSSLEAAGEIPSTTVSQISAEGQSSTKSVPDSAESSHDDVEKKESGVREDTETLLDNM